MKKIFFLLIFLILIGNINLVFGFSGHSFYLGRPQGMHAERELVGWQTIINKSCEKQNYYAFAVQPCYGQSFNAPAISEFLFGCLPWKVSGSQVPNRGACDILADYFGLPVDYQSTACFNPTIKNITTNFDFYCGLDEYVQGLYVRAHMPLTYTQWNLNMCETIINAGTAFFPAGYVGAARSNRSGLAKNLSDFFCAQQTFGAKELLEFGKICCARTKISIADFYLVTGWNLTGPDYHAGLNFRLIIPTGNKPTASYLFDPIVGNGYHWEMGGGLTTHYDIWKSCDEQYTFALYCDANITHLVKSKQLRSYDLINGPGSRYMVAQAFITPSADLYFNAPLPGGTAAPNQYRRKLHQVINLTTLESLVSFDIQADVVLKLMFTCGNIQCDIGYDFWARSKEKLHCRAPFPLNQIYALKGDAQIYGFTQATNIPVSLNVSQHNATLFGGQGNGNANYQNLNADSPVPAADSTALLNQLNTADSAALGIAQVVVDTSNPAILLKDSDINNCSALLPRALSNTFFFHLNYIWDECCNTCKPFIGFGGEVEVAAGCAQNNSTYSQWNVWIKGGLGF